MHHALIAAAIAALVLACESTTPLGDGSIPDGSVGDADVGVPTIDVRDCEQLTYFDALGAPFAHVITPRDKNLVYTEAPFGGDQRAGFWWIGDQSDLQHRSGTAALDGCSTCILLGRECADEATSFTQCGRIFVPIAGRTYTRETAEAPSESFRAEASGVLFIEADLDFTTFAYEPIVGGECVYYRRIDIGAFSVGTGSCTAGIGCALADREAI